MERKGSEFRSVSYTISTTMSYFNLVTSALGNAVRISRSVLLPRPLPGRNRILRPSLVFFSLSR